MLQIQFGEEGKSEKEAAGFSAPRTAPHFTVLNRREQPEEPFLSADQLARGGGESTYCQGGTITRG